MRNLWKKPVVRITLGMTVLVLGLWMVSPAAIIPYRPLVIEKAGETSFFFYYILAIIFMIAGLGAILSCDQYRDGDPKIS